MPPGPNLRRKLRQLLKRGKLPESPLLLPIACAVASQIEGLPAERFLSDPTKLAKGLNALQQTLALDGITCFSSSGADAESLGATLDWSTYPPRIATQPANPIGVTESPEDAVLGHPRVVCALEVCRRLKTRANDDVLLSGLLTGPHTLAVRLAGQEYSADLLERCVRLQLALCRALGEAGIDVIFILEDHLPTTKWSSVLAPIIKVIRFYQALPVMLFPELTSAKGLVLPTDAVSALPKASAITLPLPAQLLPLSVEQWSLPETPGMALLTSAGEVPFNYDIPLLRASCQRLRQDRSS